MKKNNSLKECQLCGRMDGKFRCVRCGRHACGVCFNRVTRLCRRCSHR